MTRRFVVIDYNWMLYDPLREKFDEVMGNHPDKFIVIPNSPFIQWIEATYNCKVKVPNALSTPTGKRKWWTFIFRCEEDYTACLLQL